MPGDLVVLVVVYTLNDVYFTTLSYLLLSENAKSISSLHMASHSQPSWQHRQIHHPTFA